MKKVTTVFIMVLVFMVASALAADIQTELLINDAFQALDGGDYPGALKEFSQAANSGNARAQGALGYMYVQGKGVEQDYTKALYWYRKAVKQGYAPSLFNLGLMYAQGEGVKQDYVTAVSWYRKAMKQGYTEAQTQLGFVLCMQMVLASAGTIPRPQNYIGNLLNRGTWLGSLILVTCMNKVRVSHKTLIKQPSGLKRLLIKDMRMQQTISQI